MACTENAQSSSPASAQAQALAVDGGSAGSDRHHGPGHPHGPPPEAFDACQSKAVGDACNVSIHDENIAGTCTAPPASTPDARAFCRPAGMPEGGPPHGGRPHGPPPPEVVTACDGKTSGATCSVTFGDHTMNGSCLAPPPDSGETRLACAPPRP